MSRIAYVNGQYVPHRQAVVHIEDRGYQFADGVYEVCAISHGRLIDETLHLRRLARSLGELRIPPPMTEPALQCVLRETVRRNRVDHGHLYLQITRGVAPRDHAFPAGDAPPSLVVTVALQNRERLAKLAGTGVAVVTLPDQRWGRCDIKSIALLPNVLAKQTAREQGAYEAWLVDAQGYVTEGASTNAWIVDQQGRLRTRPLGSDILNGVTRQVLIGVLEAQGVALLEEAFTVAEVHTASEAFISSSTAILLPVIQIDGKKIGTGQPGPLTQRLRAAYRKYSAPIG